MNNLLGMTIEELKQFAAEMGEKPYRGKQIFIWLKVLVFIFPGTG